MIQCFYQLIGKKKKFQALVHTISIQKQLINLFEPVIWETLLGIAASYIGGCVGVGV